MVVRFVLLGVSLGLALGEVADYSEEVAQLVLGSIELVVLEVVVAAVHPLRVNAPVFAYKVIRDVAISVPLDLLVHL